MTHLARRLTIALALLATVGLAACGGGGVEVRDVAEDTTATTAAGADDTVVEPTTTTTEAGTTDTTAAPLPENGDVPDAQQPGNLGDDPVLDSLADDCFGGDFAACDQLFFDSDADSAYEAYGDSCGGRNEPAGLCVDIYGGP